MSDESKGLSFSGEPGGLPQTSSGSGEGETQQYLTRKEAEGMMAQLREESKRHAQSLADKAEDRTNKRIREEMANLKKLANAAQLTPEQVAAARAKIFEDAYADEPASLPSSTQATQPAQVEQRNQPAKSEDQVYAERATKRIARKYGIDIDESDPEAQDLQGAADVDDWIERYEAAVQRKRQRVTTPAAGRMPTMGGAPSGDKLTKLQQQYQEDLKQVRRGDVMAVHALQRKYREQGLNI